MDGIKGFIITQRLMSDQTRLYRPAHAALSLGRLFTLLSFPNSKLNLSLSQHRNILDPSDESDTDPKLWNHHYRHNDESLIINEGQAHFKKELISSLHLNMH